MMTKEDYMRLPKERLAELLVERDMQEPFKLYHPILQCYEPGGTCTNPFRDCINCPKQFGGSGGTFTSTEIIKKLQYEQKEIQESLWWLREF